jgi:hypothetical protein
MKDEFIRDKIVCGIISNCFQKQLLKERALTLDKAVQICQLNELSEDYGKQLSKRESDKRDVNYIKPKKPLRKQSSILSNLLPRVFSLGAQRRWSRDLLKSSRFLISNPRSSQ